MITRPINAMIENQPYLPNRKAYELQTWYLDGIRWPRSLICTESSGSLLQVTTCRGRGYVVAATFQAAQFLLITIIRIINRSHRYWLNYVIFNDLDDLEKRAWRASYLDGSSMCSHYFINSNQIPHGRPSIEEASFRVYWVPATYRVNRHLWNFWNTCACGTTEQLDFTWLPN